VSDLFPPALLHPHRSCIVEERADGNAIAVADRLFVCRYGLRGNAPAIRMGPSGKSPDRGGPRRHPHCAAPSGANDAIRQTVSDLDTSRRLDGATLHPRAAAATGHIA